MLPTSRPTFESSDSTPDRTGRPGRAGALPPAVVLTELYPPAVGGSAVLFQGVYSRWSDVDVSVITDRVPGTAPTKAAEGPQIVWKKVGTPYCGVLHPKGLLHYLRLAAALRAIASPRRALVHCGRALPEGCAARLASLAGGPSYVCWVHGEELGYFSTSREFTALMRWVFQSARAVIANSHHTAALLGEIGVPDAKVRVVHPGVDATRFRPDLPAALLRRRFAADQELLLLSVGRLQRRKGHDLCIQALALLSRELPHLRYLIVGDGQERVALQNLAVECGVSDRVSFAGEVSADMLATCYAAADIFLLPNRLDGVDFEGFGIVFLEAAACGLPVIGGASGGVGEAVEHGRTGFLVGGCDAEELAAAIRRLAAAPGLRREMGRAGRQRVVEQFTWEAASNAVKRIHTELGRPR